VTKTLAKRIVESFLISISLYIPVIETMKRRQAYIE
jgi:hypothetical protein